MPDATLAWLHTFDPVALQLGPIAIRWYGLAYVAGFLIAWLVLRWLGKRGFTPIPPDRAGDAIMVLILGVLLGGRLGYVLIYQPALLWDFSSAPPWWGLLAINRGGMASHGAMVGLILAAGYAARGFKLDDGTRSPRLPWLHVVDLVALLAPFGVFLGRIANFINGELLGRIVAMPGEPAPWWAVRFPEELLTGHAPRLTPEQVVGLTELSMRATPRDPGNIELLIAKVRSGNAELARQLEPFISARHPSQIYQAVAEGIVVGLIVWFVATRPRKPGVITAWCLISYGVLRVVTEFWRLPDDHLAVQRLAGLSRGQWLSMLMVVAGAVLMGVIARRDTPRIGGWIRQAP